jgi:hypothetical protein
MIYRLYHGPWYLYKLDSCFFENTETPWGDAGDQKTTEGAGGLLFGPTI